MERKQKSIIILDALRNPSKISDKYKTCLE